MFKFLSRFAALCALFTLSACVTEKIDVPAPDDPDAALWTSAVKSSYPDWQAPVSMPAPNPDYQVPVRQPAVVIASVPEAAAPVAKLQPETIAPASAPAEKPAANKVEKNEKILPPVARRKPLTDRVDYAVTEEYVVRNGDTLSTIAQKFYHNGNFFLVIVEANKDTLPDPNLIRPGMKLRLPVLLQQKSAPVEKPVSAPADPRSVEVK